MGNIVLYHYISTYFSISEVSLITFSQIIYHSDKSSWRFTLWILGKLLHFASANFAQNEKLRRTGLANLSAVPQATIKSILNDESKNPGVVTIKKLCDGLEITLGEFFSTPEFDTLEQEIK